MEDKFIYVRVQREMFHRYKNAPSVVNFLRNVHRHLFYFFITIEVSGNNREIEFFMFKKDVEKIINKLDKNVDNKSCEMLCQYVIEGLRKIKKYQGREISVDVSEDNENGARVFYYD